MQAYLRHMLNEAFRKQDDAIILAMLSPGCHNVCKLHQQTLVLSIAQIDLEANTVK